MKRHSIISTILAAVLLVTGIFPAAGSQAFALPSAFAAQEELVARDLQSLGLFKGVSQTDFALDRAPTRTEAIVMLIRVLGKEAEALEKSRRHPFTDVPAWADRYVGYAFENGLTSGVSATKFGTGDASSAMYLTFVLRALGYSDQNARDFTWDSPYRLASAAGILPEGADTGRFRRSDVVLVSYAALSSKLKDSDKTLAERLIEQGVFSRSDFESIYDAKKLEYIDAPYAVTSGGYTFAYSDVKPYSGAPYCEINGGVPSFSAELFTRSSFESYAQLDSLGRCGAALANVGPDLMPTAPRESIGMVRPSGFRTDRYDELIPGKYLYNRCHLIAYQLSGENSNERNLITGTYYMNVSGMQPFENRTADYLKRTGNHVLYRATPVFSGRELVARGVLIEACSVEDGGSGLMFSVFVYNVQPGVIIDYATGESRTDETYEPPAADAASDPDLTSRAWSAAGLNAAPPESAIYVLNLHTGVFHLPGCRSVSQMSEKNKFFTDSDRELIVAHEFRSCGNCRP